MIKDVQIVWAPADPSREHISGDGRLGLTTRTLTLELGLQLIGNLYYQGFHAPEPYYKMHTCAIQKGLFWRISSADGSSKTLQTSILTISGDQSAADRMLKNDNVKRALITGKSAKTAHISPITFSALDTRSGGLPATPRFTIQEPSSTRHQRPESHIK
jgi:hypothetical protein